MPDICHVVKFCRHLGNVLVRTTPRSEVRIDSKTKFHTAGLTVSVIDFSLTRLTTAAREDIYRNLANDSWLFEGDSSLSSQYDVYRRMATMFQNNDWSGYCPKTNVIWLHHILESLLQRLPANRAKGPCYDRLTALSSLIADHNSASSLVRVLKDL